MRISDWSSDVCSSDLVMGDIVLTDTEVNPVMAKLIAGGIEITALHNHLLRNAPHTMYMHIGGRGDPAQLAKVLHDALALSGTPLSAPTAASPAAPEKIDPAPPPPARPRAPTGK